MLLNGLLMVTIVGGAVILWLDNRVQVGSVVAAHAAGAADR